MIIYSIIQKSQLEGAQRLDAEYYQPEYLEVKNRLQSIPNIILGDHAFVTDGEHGSVEFEEEGVKYLTAENVTEGYLKLDDVRYVSGEVDRRNKRATLQTGDVTLSIKGTVGLAAIVFKENLPANMNRDVSRVHIKDSIDPYFLVIYLNSKFGRRQTLRESSGNVQQMITLSRIRELLVPKLSEGFTITIQQLFLESRESLESSKKYYKEAENLFLEELGMTDFRFPEDLTYIVNYLDTHDVTRIDADYFQPKYKVLESKLQKYGVKLFREMIVNVPATFNPLAKPDDLFKYVDLANINSSIGIVDGYEELLGKEAPGRAKRLLESGDVIVSSVEGSLEKIALVDDSQKGYLASTGFFQLRSKEIFPEALLVLSRSIVFQMQLKKRCTGTILTAVPKESISDILIPLLPKPIQQKIADLVKKSHEARKKSKELLEEAKRKVEEMIERGGDNNG